MRLATILLAVLLTPGAAWAELCKRPDGEPVRIDVETKIAKTAYRHDLGKQGIERLQNKTNGSATPGTTVGLTVAAYGYRLSMGAKAWRRSDGAWCQWISNLRVEVSIPEQTVYVAREYPAGSCEYGAVIEHENEHVRLNESILRNFGAQLGRPLRAAVDRMNPIVASENSSEIPRPLKTTLERLMRDLEADRARANAAIDTEQNYRATSTRCRNW
ncbi:MAG: hypothetical protein HQL38_12910 [Alphaproteobacteria bacterium]|nr:hypothetical protein [Alphaproteobacteria bacterium]